MSDLLKGLAAEESIRAQIDLAETIRRERLLSEHSLKAMGDLTAWAEQESALERMARDIERNQAALQAVIGPMAHLSRAGLLGSFDAELERARQIAGEFNAQFRLPGIAETRLLLEQARDAGALGAMAELQRFAPEIDRAYGAMRAPWLDSTDQIASLAGFTDLQGIGLMLSHSPGFDEHVTDVLRAGLGDWRESIVWPEHIFSDPFARSAFYVERGLDIRLTRFPLKAFDEGMRIAGLRDDSPEDKDQDETTGQDEDIEAAFARTKNAHGQVQRLEWHFRRFFEKKLGSASGDQWIKQRMPSDVYQYLMEAKQKAQDKGEKDRPLIEYADFTHYEKIISRADNWKDVFQSVFRRREFVTESFQRLYPIRNCTAHSRLITPADELYLYVEVKRLLNAIGVEFE